MSESGWAERYHLSSPWLVVKDVYAVVRWRLALPSGVHPVPCPVVLLIVALHLATLECPLRLYHRFHDDSQAYRRGKLPSCQHVHVVHTEQSATAIYPTLEHGGGQFVHYW